MQLDLAHRAPVRRKPVPRGLAADGPPILSYGFRPFFLCAGIYSVLAMAIWIYALTVGGAPGGSYGLIGWHAHEMLFGYSGAALAGFLLTAVPNWTGRLPVSGRPLLMLVGLWVMGRMAMLTPDLVGLPVAVTVDGAFLPVLALIIAREIVSGRNWRNLKVLTGVTALALANIGMHWSVLADGDPRLAARFAIAVFVLLIALIGGRIVPSFTRNWLARQGATRLPTPFGRFDMASIIALAAALLAFTFRPEAPDTALLALVAAGLQAVRLWRWRGYATAREPLVLILHLGYGFVVLGLVAVALAALDVIAQAAALHVLTVGAIGTMTLAVMTRACRGHTGHPLTASRQTSAAYLALIVATLARPMAEILPEAYHLWLGISGAAWLAGFSLFLVEYAPMLLRPNAGSKAAAQR